MTVPTRHRRVAMPEPDGRDTVLLAAGGTGGHVFPGLATAAALTGADADLDVVFVGTADRLEARLVPEAGFDLHTVPAMAFRKDASLLKLPLVMARALRSVGRLVRERRVVAAVCFGGYTSVPLALAARRHGIPLVVHEQNAIAGRANRLAARGAAAVAITFEEAAGQFRGRTVLTGNPVRPGLLPDGDPREVRAELREEAVAAFGLDPDRRTLLVFGGSQGARRINQAVVHGLGRWRHPSQVQLLVATGSRTHAEFSEEVAARLDEVGAAAPHLVVREFIDRMDLAYAAADLVVCRAGASSIAELTALGLPSVLVPYPYATDDHQAANARALEAAGGAVVVPDDTMDADRLVAVAEPLLAPDGPGQAMADAAAAFGRPDAADALAALVLELADR